MGPLLLAATAAFALCAYLRWSAPAPHDYDEYYHVALAREMRSGPRIESFHWTPFSLLYDHFVDSTPLFHLLLMPFAGLRLETATLVGVLLGELFVFASLAWALHRLRAPSAWWFLLALPAMGTIVLGRLTACRPHLWLIGFAVLVAALLYQRRWRTLAVTCALFGLTHTAGWIAVPMALLWMASGWVLPEEARESRPPWQPLAATLGGWLTGQLLHPEMPANFRLFWISNFVIPFEATGAGNAALRSQLGTELLPPRGRLLFEQWPVLLPAALALIALLRYPRLRTRATVTSAALALAFLAAGFLLGGRFLELGVPLVLLALALVAREWSEQALPRPAWLRGGLPVLFLVVALAATLHAHQRFDAGKWSPPREMARWLGEHGAAGERVFTAQWADSAPLFYSAPQLQSLVALDPTMFYLKDPARFATYVDIVQRRHPDPVAAIRQQFGARWVTVWKAYPRFGMSLQRAGAQVAYSDHDYVVFDLGPPAAQAIVTSSQR